MILTCCSLTDATSRRDPTGTEKLRILARKNAVMILNRLCMSLKTAVVNHDLLALGPQSPSHYSDTHLRHSALSKWLASVSSQAFHNWLTRPIAAAWVGGISAARKDVRGPDPEDNSAIFLVWSGTELAGILGAGGQLVSRAALHIQKGTRPVEAYRTLRGELLKIRPRLEALANMAIVKTFNTARLATYEAAGVKRVGVVPESLRRGNPLIQDTGWTEEAREAALAARRANAKGPSIESHPGGASMIGYTSYPHDPNPAAHAGLKRDAATLRSNNKYDEAIKSKLNDLQLVGLFRYIKDDDFAQNVNKPLREGTANLPGRERVREAADVISSALAQLPKYTSGDVYRTIQIKGGRADKLFKENSVVEFKAFTSTTKNRGLAEGISAFGELSGGKAVNNKTVFTLKNAGGVDVSGISPYDHEQVLIDKGSHFHIDSVKKREGGGWSITATRVSGAKDADPLAPYRAMARRRRGVGTMVQVRTAEDDLVCVDCEDAAEAGPYSVVEAYDMFPMHVNCRCSFVPYDADDEDDLEEDSGPFDPVQLALLNLSALLNTMDTGWTEEAREAALAARRAAAHAAGAVSAGAMRVGARAASRWISTNAKAREALGKVLTESNVKSAVSLGIKSALYHLGNLDDPAMNVIEPFIEHHVHNIESTLQVTKGRAHDMMMAGVRKLMDARNK